MPAKHLEQGQRAEHIAQQYLQQQGLVPVAHNYRCKLGEIDLIMHDQQTLVFIEVRYRKSAAFGSGADTIDYRKQQKLSRTANHYLTQQKQHNRPCRFDVVSVTGVLDKPDINWINNAFMAHP